MFQSDSPDSVEPPKVDAFLDRQQLGGLGHRSNKENNMLLNIQKRRVGDDVIVLRLAGRITLGRECQEVEWQVEDLLKFWCCFCSAAGAGDILAGVASAITT